VEGSSVHPNLQQSTQTICWYIYSVNVVFKFLYVMLYNCHHPFGFLKGDEFLDYWSDHNCVRKKFSPWRLLLMFLICIYTKHKQTAIMSFMQCKMLKMCSVSCGKRAQP
jgi:hypothetical protein